MDLDVPSCDLDLFDHETQELLAGREVETIHSGQHVLGEKANALNKAIVGGQLGPLVGERLALGLDLVGARVEFFRPALDLCELEESSLIEICHASALVAGGIGSAIKPCQLGIENLVVGCGPTCGHRDVTGRQDVRAEQSLSDLVEDECVQFVGTDVTFRTAKLLAAGAEGVVVPAVVVAVEGAVASMHLAAADRGAARAAAHHAAQDPGLGAEVTRTPL
jgi:hypothetical protein